MKRGLFGGFIVNQNNCIYVFWHSKYSVGRSIKMSPTESKCPHVCMLHYKYKDKTFACMCYNIIENYTDILIPLGTFWHFSLQRQERNAQEHNQCGCLTHNTKMKLFSFCVILVCMLVLVSIPLPCASVSHLVVRTHTITKCIHNYILFWGNIVGLTNTFLWKTRPNNFLFTQQKSEYPFFKEKL